MSNFIYNEIPSGSVNGINKEFTVINEIERIEEVYVGNASYRNISFSGNVITLEDAPLIGMSISVDYFKAGLSPTPTTSDVTLGEIIDDVYEKIGQNRSGNMVYKESQIRKNIVKEFERVKNKKLLPDGTRQYNFNSSKGLSAKGYNASYVEVGADLKYIPSHGALMLSNSVVVPYNNYTDGKLFCTPGIEYKSGSDVLVGYKIPNGVKKISEVLLDGFPLEYGDIREYSISNKYYTIATTSDGNKYIFLPYTASSERIVTVKYYPTQLLAALDADIVDIEYEYSEVLSYYALWKAYEDREDDRADRAERSHRELLREYRAYKSKNTYGIRNQFRTLTLPSYGKK